MAKKLEGDEYLVFRSLVREWHENTPERIRVELTRSVDRTLAEVEATLVSLNQKGYIEENPPGRWVLTPNGHGVQRSLLGELRDDDS